MLQQIKQNIINHRESSFYKLFIIGVITLVMLIPVNMIENLIHKRHSRQESVNDEIGATWGRAQTVGGPVLSIPYQVHHYQNVQNENGQWYKTHSTSIQYAVFLSESLEMTGEIKPDIRYRGIFKVPVYTAHLNFKGAFGLPNFETLDIKQEDVLWDKAVVFLPISDLKGIRKIPILDWNGLQKEFGPAIKTIDGFGPTVQAKLPMDHFGKEETQQPFSFSLTLAGSRLIHFLPLGKRTTVSMKSVWNTPKFSGNFLPETRSINENGFDADWEILELARNFPQQWKEADFPNTDFTTGSFGVDLLFPVGIYQQTTRSVKYSILFILLTFVSFFLFEILGDLRIHPVQYLMVGFAVCLFYLNLLSISERFDFAIAYLIATTSTIGLIFGYCLTVLKGKVRAAIMGGFLVVLYGFLFGLLTAESYSLLMGSSGLFLILAFVMFLTRKFD